MSWEHNKPFVLGQSRCYRVVSLPVKNSPEERTLAFEVLTTNRMGEEVWFPCDGGLEAHRELLSSLLHRLYREANRK